MRSSECELSEALVCVCVCERKRRHLPALVLCSEWSRLSAAPPCACPPARPARSNLKGTFLTGQAAARQMVAQQRGGAIITMSSVNAVTAIPTIAGCAGRVVVCACPRPLLLLLLLQLLPLFLQLPLPLPPDASACACLAAITPARAASTT